MTTEPGTAGTQNTSETGGGVGKLSAVVLDVPDLKRETAFWSALTGATAEEEADWVTLRTPDRWRLDLQPAPNLVPPQWPGQEHPQQVHVDLRVPDLAEATARAVELGARVLRENQEWNTLADPAGHPFDLCFAEGNPGVTVMGVTFDCPDASALAAFYSGVLGDPVTYDSDGMAMLGGDRTLLFQQVEGYTPPAWPDPSKPQQAHLDIKVQNLAEAEAAVQRLGATRLQNPEDSFHVWADPAGHPFCLFE